ncbi:MAG: type III polyketide synthase [Parvularcula sp.]|nr:type III polyketide synthase [Parvularcula sp.]
MTEVFVNALHVAVPSTPCHELFKTFARRQVRDREAPLLERMMSRSGIEERYSVLTADGDGGSDRSLDDENFYTFGEFPTTHRRMKRYRDGASSLALKAVKGLQRDDLKDVTHIVLCTCTGFSAPGLEHFLIEELGLADDVRSLTIGFMGCFAGVTSLRTAGDIVRSDPDARVLVVAIELCTLHLQETSDLESILSFALFGDGAAAAIVSSEPGLFRLDGFDTVRLSHSSDLITWDIGDQGFDMRLSGRVPGALKEGLSVAADRVVPQREGVDLWAIHPGGKTILDAATSGLELEDDALDASRSVLRDYGNMSSASIFFVLGEHMARRPTSGARGVGMAFGPGLTAECFSFAIC